MSLISNMDNGKLGVGVMYVEPPTTLPPKVCHYGKPKLYWFGEVHGSNNFIWNDGYTMARHWDVTKMHVETKTLNKKTEAWVPQGEIIIASGQPLRMNNKSKETIERVKEIEFP